MKILKVKLNQQKDKLGCKINRTHEAIGAQQVCLSHFIYFLFFCHGKDCVVTPSSVFRIMSAHRHGLYQQSPQTAVRAGMLFYLPSHKPYLKNLCRHVSQKVCPQEVIFTASFIGRAQSGQRRSRGTPPMASTPAKPGMMAHWRSEIVDADVEDGWRRFWRSLTLMLAMTDANDGYR